MFRAEGRELDVLPAELRHRRPVVGERRLGLGRTERRQVVTPDPAAELQVAVALLRPRQPGVPMLLSADAVAWLIGDSVTARYLRTSWSLSLSSLIRARMAASRASISRR